MVDLSEHLRNAVRARWAKATDDEKAAAARHASRAYWDAMSPEERSVEMKRRAQVRKPAPAMMDVARMIRVGIL